MRSLSSWGYGGIIIAGELVLIIIGIIIYYFAKRSRKQGANSVNPGVLNFEIDIPGNSGLHVEGPVRLSAQQLYDFTNNYSTKLGSGGFGVVYKGSFPDGVPIAVKLLKKKKQDKAAGQQFMDEVAAISATNHVNLVKLFGFCYDHLTVALVFEYMENGSLDKYLFRDSSTTVGWDQLYKVAIGTARGIAYLHEESQPRIVHYDIKPANILLDENFTPKVADFGLAKLCNEDGTHADVREYRGTPGYSAPEFVTKKSAVTNKCDVYSFGMVLFEIIGRRRNAQSDSVNSLDWFPKRVWDMYEKGGLEEFVVGNCGFEEKDRKQVERAGVIALWCVQSSGEARPKMSDVVKMLEGEVEIMQPPKPFNYNGVFSTTPTPPPHYHYSTTSSTSTSTDHQTNSYSRSCPV